MATSLSSIPDTIRDLWDLLVAYTKQETIDPLRNIGRFVAYGVGGMVIITVGCILLSLAVLRAMQTQTGDLLAGFWSWVPYAVVSIALAALVGLAISRIGKGNVGTAGDLKR
jgi:choline-glycine betaine transporter